VLSLSYFCTSLPTTATRCKFNCSKQISKHKILYRPKQKIFFLYIVFKRACTALLRSSVVLITTASIQRI
jgi:hypothetical protein